MANQDNHQQNMMPVDPFSPFMWGPPPGIPPFQMMPPAPMQNQGQGTSGTTAPNFFNGSGTFDFNKLMDSADKMVKLINQTQPMLKQLAPLLNMFKQS